MNNASDGSGGISTIHPPQFNTFTTVVGPQIMTTLVTETEKSQVSTLEVIDQKNQHSQNTSTCEIPSSVATTHANENLVNTSLFVHSRNMATSPTNSVLPSSSSSQKMLLDSQLSKGYKSTRTFKVIIVGDAGVGKTCLSFRFCCGRFPEHTESTIGVDFRDRCCVIERELLRVQLWDTAGQERYRQSIIAHYYRNVNAVVFVYDVTNKNSFDSLRGWINECEKHGLTAEGDVPRILIGNKCDLLTENKVPMDIAQMFADRNNMALFETSAKSDSEADHVESIFLTLLHKLQQSKPMHVQTESERQAKEQKKLVLKASEAASLEESGWCC